VNRPRIIAAGDAVVIVEFDERIDSAVNAAVVSLAERLRAEAAAGVLDIVPTYRSVAIYFDPLRTQHEALMARLEREALTPAAPAAGTRKVLRIPVCYGGEYGPDLPEVAAFGGVSEPTVVDLHTRPTYHVFMLGFAPGLAYLGIVDDRIAAPRRATPRVRVPRGSVGIAGAQTGVYPAETPGGWQIVGRTPVKTFDLTRSDPFLLKPGDAVSFYAIDRSEFDRLDATGAGSRVS
jgi:inhibitor of KinA